MIAKKDLPGASCVERINHAKLVPPLLHQVRKVLLNKTLIKFLKPIILSN